MDNYGSIRNRGISTQWDIENTDEDLREIEIETHSQNLISINAQKTGRPKSRLTNLDNYLNLP